MKLTEDTIADYVKAQGWSGYYPDRDEYKLWEGETLESGFDAFKKHRDTMFESVKAEFQANHSALSQRGANAYADNWN